MESHALSTNDNVFWKNHQGVRYLYVDFTDLDDYAIIRVSQKLNQVILNEPDNSIRAVCLLKGLNVGFHTHTQLRQLSKNIQPKLKKTAIVGMSPLVMPFFLVYKQFTKSKAKLFDTLEESVEYICS